MIKLNILPRLLLQLLLMAGVSCSRNPQTDAPPPPPGGIITKQPIGKPIGDNYTEMIGSGGGTVVSPDGLLEIEIPAGALPGDTEIGIQPLRHTATSGIGNSYRLTPHGTLFRKKVTVRFHYWKYQEMLGSTLAPEIVYQKESGEWVCTGSVVNDTVQQTVSVQTDHFSDWGFIASMELSPAVKTLGVGKSVSLKALRYVHPGKDGDWVVPLTVPNAGTGEPMKIENSYIVKWRLNGPGKLESNGAEATYTAPASVPANSAAATISVELNVKGKQVLLISTVHIVEEGIQITIDGGGWHTWPGWAAKMGNQFSFSTLRVSEDVPQIVCMWPKNDKGNSNGMHAWAMLYEGDVTFEYDEPNLRYMWISIFDDGVSTYDSAGFLSVEEIEENGKKFITGAFSIEKAGYLDRPSGQQLRAGNIKGTFKLPRNW